MKPLQDKQPIPVSTSTRNKLNAFQFTGTDHASTGLKRETRIVELSSGDEQENFESRHGTRKTPIKKDNPPQHAEDQLLLPELQQKDVPVTPAGRLALLDLVGMGDARASIQEVSPEERIEWDHNKDMVQSSASGYSGVRRVRKRARSSSPVSSSPANTSGRRRPRELPNTPVDPGSDLWGRFSLNGSNAPTPQAMPLPAHTNMYTSSPQPAKGVAAPRTIAGFRRANSCGNQFPKRRRVGTSDDVFTDGVMVGPSKLSVLIERVQEHLTEPHRSTASSRSTSPAKQFKDHNEDEESQPMEGLTKSTSVVTELRSPSYPRTSPRKSIALGTSNSSDYGDDDIDESFIDSIGDVQQGAILHPESVSSTGVIEHQALARQVNACEQPPSTRFTTTKEELQVYEEEDDEFGSDVEMFAADMELLAAKYDTPITPQAKAETIILEDAVVGLVQPRSLQIPDSEASDDEFGTDGLDESDLAAAESTATQSIQQSAGGLLPVRPRT